MIYRGQGYGEPVGEWWTSKRADAEKFAMSRGGNRNYVVLSLDEDDEDWLRQFVFCDWPPEGERGTWYKIPLIKLRERWRGVSIASGSLSLEVP